MEETMNTPALEKVILKEDAVFWMDERGDWHNAAGRFRNRRIIDYFNRHLQSDAGGFFVAQMNGPIREKVYFRYSGTALFVLDLEPGDPIILVLNTGEKCPLAPDSLFVKNDVLHMRQDCRILRFRERPMIQLSSHISLENGQYRFEWRRRTWAILEGE